MIEDLIVALAFWVALLIFLGILRLLGGGGDE